MTGNDKEATIRLDSTNITMDIVLSPTLLRKVIRVADRVCVVGGAGDGRVGWVVAVDGTELHVWEDKTALPFKVNTNHVTFHHDTQALVRVAAKQDVSWKPFEENQHPLPRRNLVYLGRHVIVIRKGVFKGYEGIIQDILEDDEVCIELSATLKNDDNHKPLMYKYHSKAFQFDMPPPAQPALIPQSLVPLTPSTPLPAGSSARWKGGEYEGKKGLWKASDTMEPGIARVQILVPPTTIYIPGISIDRCDSEGVDPWAGSLRTPVGWVIVWTCVCSALTFYTTMIPRLKKKDLMRERPPTPSYTPSARP
ncbi:hypothetical protein DXG01_002084 [Tephrocybe rancida]|nr:hypothetical protein DXG01_002084 [Tephrocybe rancida]